MHTNVLWLGLVLLLALGGLAAVATFDPHVIRAEKEADPVTIFSSQAATDAWQWHKDKPLPYAWYGVVESAAQLQSLLADHAFLTDRLPVDIDWSKDALLVAALGEAPTGGYAVRIRQVIRQGGELQVVVHRRSPGSGDLVTQVFTYPVDCVRLKRDQLAGAGRIAFVDQKGLRFFTAALP